jgi:hypothetical protein
VYRSYKISEEVNEITKIDLIMGLCCHTYIFLAIHASNNGVGLESVLFHLFCIIRQA